MKILFPTTLLCLIFLLNPAISSAQDVAVGIDHFPPWKIVKSGPIGGIDVALTTALLNEIGMKPEFVPYPWARCLEMLKSGQLHLVSGILRTPEREQYLLYVEPPYKTESAKVFYRLKSTKDIQTIDDLDDLVIGVQRNAKYFDVFDNKEGLKKEVVNDDKFNFLKLAQSRIDTVLTTESQGDYLVATLELGHLVTKSSYRHDETVPVYFAVSRHSPLSSRGPELNAAAQRLRDNGTFAAIIQNYFDTLKKNGK